MIIEEQNHPHASRLICASYKEIAKHIRFSAENNYIVVMTHAHVHDELVLRQLANEEYRYLGIIGSKNKTRTLFERLLKDGYDEKYDEAVALVGELGHASISLVQRYMKIGYNRAARMIEQMEREGIVGPSDGAKPRKVLIRKLPR